MSDRTLLTSAVCPECHLHRGHRASCSTERERLHGPEVDLSLEAYRAFLKEKIVLSEDFGFEIELDEIHPWFKPHQKVTIQWMVRGGRRAAFLSFGLGKSGIQLEVLRLILKRVGGRALIVAPLGVRQEFARDAETLGIELKFIRSIDEAGETGIYITNYETVRDGNLNPALFSAASLDEAAILASFGGTKTFREFMRLFEGVPYRFVATATPDPNEYIELLAYAAWLGVMEVSAAKTRWFKRDSTKADKLTLHAHKAQEFWCWVSSWGLFLNRPSDLGPEFSDEGYSLPPLDIVFHQVAVDHSGAQPERDGQSRMFKDATHGVVEASREKRDTIALRIERMVAIVRSEILGKALARREQGEGVCPESQILRTEHGTGEGQETSALSQDETHGYGRAESSKERIHEGLSQDLQEKKEDARGIGRTKPFETRTVFDGPGVSGENARPLQKEELPKSPRQEGDENQGDIRPNPGAGGGPAAQAGRRVRNLRNNERCDEYGKASDPIAVHRSLSQDECSARTALPQLQFRDRSLSGQPGTSIEGSNLSEQFIVWCDLNAEQRAVDAALSGLDISASSLYGETSPDERERALLAWRNRETQAFVSKPVMYGAGINMQQCRTVIFLGIGFKFREWIQACHRVYRFLQTRHVVIHIIYAESEKLVLENLLDKWERHKQQLQKMSEIIAEHGLSRAAMDKALARSMGVARHEECGEKFRFVNNDCIDELHRMESNSIGLVCSSPPFSTMYEYSPAYEDFGHTDGNEHFFKQMDFLTPQLLRVLKPGRIAAIHVKDRIVPGGVSGLGFQTVYPFHADCIRHFQKHGFALIGMKTIVTDVVRENNQTYRLGWTEQCKDGSKMGVGMPEYLLLFRKPPSDPINAYADEPVLKDKPVCIAEDGELVPFDRDLPIQPGSGYSRSKWQIDAHGFTRSSGNRPLRPEDLAGLTHEQIFKAFRKYSKEQPYDFENHVRLSEELEAKGILPVTFMLLQPQSWHPDVWTDITRMRTLNASQAAKGKEMHLCALQIDLVDRVIAQMSNPGDVVLDPFAGIATVPSCAIALGRKAYGIELSAGYFADGMMYCRGAEQKINTPTLFDLLESEDEVNA